MTPLEKLSQKIESYDISIGTYLSDIKVLYSKTLSVSDIQKVLYQTAEGFNPDDIDDSTGTAAVTIARPDERCVYLLLDKKTTVNTLHHECIHVVMFLFSFIQTNHTFDTDEVFAYLSEAIFTEIYKALTEKFHINKKTFLTI